MNGPAASLDALEGETIRVPRNIMGLLRQSYDSREKVLDWLLAFSVALALAYLFQDQIRSLFLPDPDVNANLDDPPQPSQAVDEAIPPCNATVAKIYTYNLPPSRIFRNDRGPSMTPPPANPSAPPSYPAG